MQTQEMVASFCSGKLLAVDRLHKGGLIVFKQSHYAEFAGPGAAVGGLFDLDCLSILAIGELALIIPTTYPERQRAYKTRTQWIRLINQITSLSNPLQRARKVLDQFEACFDLATVVGLPDYALAQLVGVFPDTIQQARHYSS